MKKPWLAFLLSFLLPGSGLWYLEKWAWGFLNLGIVLVIGLILVFILPEGTFLQYIEYVSVGLSAVSGALASGVAQYGNMKQ